MTEFLIGVGLGIVFFGGLYWTVQRMTTAKHPAFLMSASLLLRMAALIGVLFYVSKGGFRGLLFTMAGMLFVRLAMTFSVKKPR